MATDACPRGRDVGVALNLRRSDQRPAPGGPLSCFLISGIFTIWIPPLISTYNYGQRIKRAQRLTAIRKQDQINPITAFLLYFPGAILIIPLFFHFWYVTKHQDRAMRAAGGLPYKGEVAAVGAGETATPPTETQPPESPAGEPPPVPPHAAE